MTGELSNITKVIETSSTNEVNEHLGKGWRLIDTYRTSTFSTEADNQIVMYVLGKISD